MKLNDLKVIHDLYSQCLTQTLSKTTSNMKPEGVCGGPIHTTDFVQNYKYYYESKRFIASKTVTTTSVFKYMTFMPSKSVLK
jgi:hypothetical protein